MEGISKATADEASQALVRIRDAELSEDGWKRAESWIEGVKTAVADAARRGDRAGIELALENLARKLTELEREDELRPGSASGSASSMPRKVDEYEDGRLNEPLARLLREIDERKAAGEQKSL